jgi:hypothetical protein
MERDDSNESAIAEPTASDDLSDAQSDSPLEPPAVYVPACGVLCDIFWWARRPANTNR